MAGYEDLLAKGFELPFSYRLGQYLLGMGDVFGDVNKSLLQSGKLGQESLEGLERTRIAEDTLAERRREADLKMEERGWARDRTGCPSSICERLRRQAGEALYNVPRTMTDEVVTEGQAPSLEEQETQPPSFFQQLSKVQRATTMPEAHRENPTRTPGLSHAGESGGGWEVLRGAEEGGGLHHRPAADQRRPPTSQSLPAKRSPRNLRSRRTTTTWLGHTSGSTATRSTKRTSPTSPRSIRIKPSFSDLASRVSRPQRLLSPRLTPPRHRASRTHGSPAVRPPRRRRPHRPALLASCGT